MITYETIGDYLLAWRHDTSLAAVPIKMAADAHGLTIAEIEELLEVEDLPSVSIAGKRYIPAIALADMENKEQKQLTAALSLLENAARLKITVTCESLMHAIGLSIHSLEDQRTFDRILSLIHHDSQPYLTVLLPVLLRKDNTDNAMPPDSFLIFVRREGLMEGDERGFVDRQIKRVWRDYSERN